MRRVTTTWTCERCGCRLELLGCVEQPAGWFQVVAHNPPNATGQSGIVTTETLCDDCHLDFRTFMADQPVGPPLSRLRT